MKKLLLFALIFAFIQVNSQVVTVTIDPETEYQIIEGFGADGSMESWTGNGPYHNPTFLDMVVDDLGLTINRNEYFPDTTTFDNKQLGWINALDAKATASGEPIKFVSTIWSPPAEWKSSHTTYNGGSLVPVHYEEYVQYCVDLINEYKTECGVDLYALSISNEPNFTGAYNTCEWTATEYAEVIAIVGEALNAAGLDTKTFGPEDVVQYVANLNWHTAVLELNLYSKDEIDIWAIHGNTDETTAYDGDQAGWELFYNRVEPYNKQLWMTETFGYDNNWPGGAFDLAQEMHDALEYGNVSAWIWWQLSDSVLNDQVLIGNGTPTKKYYASKQYYRYIRPDAKHIESSSDDAEVLVTSFKHSQDGRLTTVLINTAASSKTVNLDMGTHTLPGTYQVYRTSASEDCIDAGTVSDNNFVLPAESVSTIVYEGTNNGPNIDRVKDTVLISDGQKTIDLSGIDDGGEGGQTITISVSSSNTLVIPTPTITYTSPDATGTLTFTPVAGSSGDVTITLLLSDDGDDTGNLNETRMSFNIKVIPFINVAPTIDSIQDFKVATEQAGVSVTFSGVSDGNDGSQSITVSADSPVSSVLNVFASYTPGSGEIVLQYVSKELEATVPVTITLVDNGGIDLGGENTTVMSFNVTVEEGYVPIGINDNSIIDNEEVIVFPNPAQNTLNIISSVNSYSNIIISDNLGRTILYKEYSDKINSSRINIQGLESGLYYIQILDDNQKVFTRQFVKE